jgi:hypothetical protein
VTAQVGARNGIKSVEVVSATAAAAPATAGTGSGEEAGAKDEEAEEGQLLRLVVGSGAFEFELSERI